MKLWVNFISILLTPTPQLINKNLDYLWCVWNMMVTGNLIWQNVVYQRLKINGEIWNCAQYIEGQLEYKIETQLRFTILPKSQVAFEPNWVLKMKFSGPLRSTKVKSVARKPLGFHPIFGNFDSSIIDLSSLIKWLLKQFLL